jgi:N-acetylglucosamine-6-sulfatase
MPLLYLSNFLVFSQLIWIATAAARPNFVVIMLDDLDILLNGTSAMPTYHREFVAKGTSFRGFVDVPVCCPSRTSTLSGRYSHNLNNTALGWCGNFKKQHEGNTWIKLLRQDGYETFLGGKYYNDYNDFCDANVHVPSDWSNVMLMCNDNLYFGNKFNIDGKMVKKNESVYLTNVIGNASISWIDNAAKKGVPFFAYIAPHSPHVPATPAHEYENANIYSSTSPRTENWDVAPSDHHWLVAEKTSNLTDDLVTFSDELFARRLRSTMSVDDILAELIQTLSINNVLENTYIALTSDHGYSLGQFRLPSGKFNAYENNIRVPFTIVGPNVPANVENLDVLVNNVDIAPTILELAGVSIDGYIHDGKSFVLQLMSSDKRPTAPRSSVWRDRLLFEYWGLGYTERGPCNNGTTACPNGAEALEDAPSNTWSGIRIVNETHNLKFAEYRRQSTDPIDPSSTNFTIGFDLNADPFELENKVIGDNAWSADFIARLREELWEVATCVAETCP